MTGLEPEATSRGRPSLLRVPKRRPRWTLRRKLALLVLGTTFIPLAGLGVLAYVVVVRRDTDSVLRQLDSVAAVQEARVEGLLYQNFEVYLPLIQNHGDLSDHLAEFRESGSAAAEAALAYHLSVIQASAPVIHSIVALTPTGNVVASHLTDDIASLSGFIAAVGRQGNVRGPLRLDSSGEVVHAMAGPVFRDGDYVGIIALETTTLDLAALVSDYSGLGRTGETLLAMKDEQGDALFVTPLRFDPDAAFTRRVPQSELNKAIVRALNGEEGVFADTVDYRGEHVLSATRYIPEEGWGIVVKMDRSEALAGAGTFGRILLVGLGVIGVAAMVGGWVAARTIRKPILELTSTAWAVATGNTSRRAAVHSLDEIGSLAAAFNTMTAALVEERDTLEQRVAERTQALGETAGRLEELVRSKADLVASVSHELRTPLTVMIGYVAEVADHWDSFTADERSELLGVALAQGTELATIIDDLLVAAQSEAGELSIRAEAVDLGPLVSEIVSQMGPSHPIGVRGADASVWAEAGRVRQILRNLLSNALRYGGPTIEVAIETSDREVHLLVCDDGLGLEGDRYEEIFEMYERGTPGAGRPGSIGIGLTISRRLARLMGGDLTYRYEAGRSVFDLTLLIPPHHDSDHPTE